MKNRLNLVAACVIVGSASISFAAEPAERASMKELVAGGYVFASSANVQGAFGAYFKTRMVLTNPALSSTTVIAALSTPAGFSASREIVLGPAQTRVFENFLADVFGYTGGGGVNLIEQGAATGGTGKPFVAVAEVYVEGANGRYSTPVIGLTTYDRVVRSGAEPGFSLVTGLRTKSANRANFGCSNADFVPVTVRAEIYTSTTPNVGSPAAVEELSLSAGGWSQKAVPVQDELVRILFWVTSGGGNLGVYCYGVNVNNASNDGTSMPAAYVPLVQ